MKTYFEGIKKNFGFGCMRLPMKDGEIDREEMNRMTDYFLENGFNYFDTATDTLEGKVKQPSGTAWSAGIPGLPIS